MVAVVEVGYAVSVSVEACWTIAGCSGVVTMSFWTAVVGAVVVDGCCLSVGEEVHDRVLCVQRVAGCRVWSTI